MSAVMTSFVTWVFTQLPSFLMAEPVRYFTGLFIVLGVIEILVRLFHIAR